MQRPPADPAVVERGRSIFSVNCSACHGADARGGQLGGPNLLRSQLVLGDQNGEEIAPVVHNGRPDKGMPPFAPLSDDDL
jgi:cytochrome c oxidase cbb3-type subunit 3